MWYWYRYIAVCFVLDHLNILLRTKIMCHFNSHVLLLHILYTYIYKLWKVLTVLSNVILSIFIYSPWHVTNYPLYTHTFKYINCIINCCIVSFLYFPHIKFLIIMLMHLQNLKYMKYVINCNIAPYIYIYIYIHIYTFPILCYYISCIYTYKTRNILTVLLIAIMSHIYIFPMLYH